MAQSNFIEEPLLLDKECYFDQRGYFKETYRKEWFQEIDNSEFNQDNLSFSISKGTLRGMHFAKHPFAQSKIVQCLQGKIIDIVVDLRSESKNYTKYFKYEMEEKIISFFMCLRDLLMDFLLWKKIQWSYIK